jgi:hypothetical protein
MSLDSVIRSWEIEVESEAERLINEGVPPYDAVEQARDIVSRRRRGKATQAGGLHAK